jgi:hypothetical protein
MALKSLVVMVLRKPLLHLLLIASLVLFQSLGLNNSNN